MASIFQAGGHIKVGLVLLWWLHPLSTVLELPLHARGNGLTAYSQRRADSARQHAEVLIAPYSARLWCRSACCSHSGSYSVLTNLDTLELGAGLGYAFEHSARFELPLPLPPRPKELQVQHFGELDGMVEQVADQFAFIPSLERVSVLDGVTWFDMMARWRAVCKDD